MKLSKFFREKIVLCHKKYPHLTQKEIAERFMINQGTVSKTLKRYHQNLTLETQFSSGRPSKISKSDWDYVLDLLNNKNDLTYQEISDKLLEDKNIKIDASNVCRGLSKLGITRKKNKIRPKKEN